MNAKMSLCFVLAILAVGAACAQVHHPGIDRGWLGVSIQNLTPKTAHEEGIKLENGAYVSDVFEDGPADGAGIKEGDVVVEFNGKKIEDAHDLVLAVRAVSPGTAAAIVVSRDGENKTLQVTVGKTPCREFSGMLRQMPLVRPHFELFGFAPDYGLRLIDLNEQLGEYFGAPHGRGVLVEEVEGESVAEKSGFKAGDVIVKVGKEPVEETRDLWESLDRRKTGDSAVVEVLRKGTSTTLSLPVENRRHGPRFKSELLPRMHDMKEQLKFNLDNLKTDLKELGKHIKEKMKELREKVGNEYTAVMC